MSDLSTPPVTSIESPKSHAGNSGSQDSGGEHNGRPGGQPGPEQRSKTDLTRGSIASTLFLFTLPTLASNVLQSLNTSINAMWIGQLLGEHALTASANANSLIFLLMSGVFGLGMAATVLVGQSLGAKDVTQVKRTIGTCLTFFAAISAVLCTIGMLATPQILSAMHTPADALPLAVAYLRPTFIALPGMYIYMFAMQALRGAGDAQTPLRFLMLSTLIDIGLNPCLILGLGPLPRLGIAGAAYATVTAQWLSLAALIAQLYRERHFLRITRSELHCLKPDGSIVRVLLQKGIPMGLQVVVVSISMFALLRLVNGYGSRTAAAYGACMQVWSYIQLPAFAVGAAVSAMAAQNVGAQLWTRVAAIVRVGIVFNILLTGSLVLLTTWVADDAFRLFLGDNPEAVALAKHIHHITSWTFILFGISFVFSSVMRATGTVMVPLLIMVVSLGIVRVSVASLLGSVLHADAIWWSFAAGSLTSLVLSVLYYRSGHWKRGRLLNVKPAPQRAGAAS